MKNQSTPSPLRTILTAGLLAGTLDGLAASIGFYLNNHKNPALVFRFIARGIFGEQASTGGTGMAAAGVFLHYLIAFIWTVVFFLIFPRLKFLSKNLVLSGMVYGLFIWLVMNVVVLPVSHGISFTFSFPKSLLGLSYIVFLVGLPIGLLIGRYYRQKTRTA
ncbi:MAG TPA: hypothetical protein PKE06_12155 [Flavilitoribacter sp.]|nr:hypothetical protein [Flavilitoribacter sp.]HMQ90784.1 hypothetical protein [Flavilitoribacter sp.]